MFMYSYCYVYLYCCVDVKLGMSQMKSNIKYKLLWIDVLDTY